MRWLTIGFLFSSAVSVHGLGAQATVVPVGPGCAPFADPVSVVFTPTGAGSFVVGSVPSMLDSNFGPSLAIASDDALENNGGTGFDLGFAFPFPGGVTAQFVDVDPNGRILPHAAATNGDPTPSAIELETAGFPMICVWTDIHVLEPGSGNVHFRAAGGTANFTWNGVKQFDPIDGAEPITFQISLVAGGAIVCTLEDFAGFNTGGASADLLVGVSDGSTTGTPELDLSALLTGIQFAPLAAYEFFDTGAAATELLDFGLEPQPRLVSLTAPVLGTNWDIQVQDLPPTSVLGGVALIDFVSVSLPLDAVGMIGCTLQVPTAPFNFVLGADGTGDSTVLTIPVPNDPAHIGLTLFVQGGSDGAPFSPIPVWLVNSIAATVGI